MTDEYYISPEPNMRLPTQHRISNPQFQAALVGAKSMRAKLAACYAMLSQQGAFSDSGPEVWELRQEVAEHVPEELKNG
jgi:hypothetical protein